MLRSFGCRHCEMYQIYYIQSSTKPIKWKPQGDGAGARFWSDVLWNTHFARQRDRLITHHQCNISFAKRWVVDHEGTACLLLKRQKEMPSAAQLRPALGSTVAAAAPKNTRRISYAIASSCQYRYIHTSVCISLLALIFRKCAELGQLRISPDIPHKFPRRLFARHILTRVLGCYI